MSIFRPAVALLVASLTLPIAACGHADGPPPGGSNGGSVDEPVPTPTLVCPTFTNDAYPEMISLSMVKASPLGAIDGSSSVSSIGSAQYSIPLIVPPARRAPALSVVYDSHAASGILGKGFGISGLSSIHRCGSNLAQDDQIRGISLSSMDHYCLDGSRLVQIEMGKDSSGTYAEYRTWPDSHTRILGYGAPAADGFDVTYFVAHFADGTEVHYGKSLNARVLWLGVTRAWNKELDVDRRGNTIRYMYATANPNGEQSTTREQVIDTITFAGFMDDKGVETLGNTVVDFEYDDNERHGKLFYEGEEISRRMQLARIDMRKNGAIVRSYKFEYGEDPTTNEALLTRVDECAEGNVLQCKPATRLDWQKGSKGFAPRAINVPVPVKDEDDQFSWTVADVTGDGAVDIATSTKDPDSGVNRWFVYENDGQGNFASPVEWFSAPFPQGFGKGWQIVPLDENGDGRIDLLIDQPDGTAWNTFRVLRSVAEPSPHFESIATAIPRSSPFRASEFTVDSHSGFTVADVNADGMSDLITCDDLRTWYGKGEYVPDDCDNGADCQPSLARWNAHLWRPDGFESIARHIDALDGVSCWTMKRFFGAVDWNADGETDLVTAGKDGHWWVHHLDVPSLQWESTPLSLALANVLGVTVDDDPVAKMVAFPLTKIRASQMESDWFALRAFFPDLNGDAYPDLLYVGPQGSNVKPFAVINEGRDEYTGFLFPYDNLSGNEATFYFSPFSRVFDYSGDGRDDLALPVADSCQGIDADTCYVIFESGGVGENAKAIRTDIPFENPEGESVAPQYLLRTADVNLDSMTDIVHPTVSHQMFVFQNQSKPNLLTSISTGRNPLDTSDPAFLPDVSFEYGPLVDGAAHAFPWQFEEQTYIARSNTSNDCAYPRACVVGGQTVVKSYSLNNGQNQAHTFTMHYRDGRAHRHGRGLLGFAEVETRDANTGISSLQRFDNVTFDSTLRTFPFVGMPVETITTTPLSMTSLESITHVVPEVRSTNAGKTYFITTRSTEKVRKEGADILERSWSSVDDIDDFGNVLQSHSGTDGIDLVHTSTRIVKNDETNWLLGMAEKETTCSTALGETSCRTSTNKFNSRGEIYRVERAPDDTTAHLVTYFLRDKFGNTTNVLADDDFGNHREACATYEPTGTFPWAMRNGAGHTSHILYHPGLGVPLSTRDANGLITKWRVDTFGRTVEQHAPDGLITTIAASRVKNAVWTTRVTESTPGHRAQETVFDSFARPVQVRKRGPDVDTAGISVFGKGVWIVQDRRYDFLGRPEWQSIPRIDGDAIAEIKGSTFEYDNAGRVTKSTSPWGLTTNVYDHDKVTTVELGPAGMATIATVVQSDALGRAITTTDAKQGITRHVYGPFSALRRVELPDGTARETKQDAYGRTIFDDDPDRGKTILEYNGFDEVVKLHDATGRHYAFEHDALGRLATRSEGLSVSTYEYDTAPNAIGFPARTKGADGHVEEYAYDTLSRPKSTTLRLADGRTFAHSRTYDAFNRVQEVIYPNGFSVVREYDSTGTLVAIHQGAGANHDLPQPAIWRLDVVNAAEQTMHETFGNGATTERVYSDETNLLESIFTMSAGKTLQSMRYDYDAQLNVKSRFDARQGKIERFGHDALNRVTCARMESCLDGAACSDTEAACDVEVHYSPTGDITFKSDVGTYMPDPVHPHAVQTAGTMQFVHDAVGNQIERPNATITYTDWDLPRQYIPKGGGAPTTFEYSGDGERVRRIQGEKETIYVGDSFERETNGNVITDRFYVHNDERVIAVVERLASGDAWRFVHSEHLGSVDVISDEAGIEIDRRSFDAWGAPRDPKWGNKGPASSNIATRRGFTGHEWDEEVGLINAKGRIYDPVVARFLQTDPIIADPLSAQTYNPYSYVRNRPLVFTDPSGFDAESELPYAYAFAGSAGARIGGEYHYPTDQIFIWTLRAAREAPAAPQVRMSEVTNAEPAPITPPALALADSAEPDMPQMPPRWMEFTAGLGTGTIVGITPFGTMVDPQHSSPQLFNHTDDYLFGKAAGEFAGGISLAYAGLGVVEGGSALALTGKGSVPGVAMAAIGGAMTAGGIVNAANAMQELGVLMMAGGAATHASLKWDNPASRPTYGHTFSDHGAKATPTQLSDRARGLGHQVGQWTDDTAAAKLIAETAKKGPGTHNVPIPSGMGRSFLADGTEVTADMARVVVKPNGAVRTAFPFNSAYAN